MVLNGKPGKFSIVAQVELFQEPETVGINSFNTDIVGSGNLTVGLARGQLAQHLKSLVESESSGDFPETPLARRKASISTASSVR